MSDPLPPIINVSVTGSNGIVVIPEILSPSIIVEPVLLTGSSAAIVSQTPPVVEVTVTTAPSFIQITPIESSSVFQVSPRLISASFTLAPDITPPIIVVNPFDFPTSVSSSYALTASVALNSPTSASYAYTASVSLNAPSTASYASTASVALYAPVSPTAISASYSLSGSYALSASWAPGVGAVSASYATTSSYSAIAQSVISTPSSASFATTASYAKTIDPPASASYAVSASWAPVPQASDSASFATTASYAVTSSFSVSASWAPTVSSSFATSASYAQSASAALSSSFAATTLAANTATSASYAQSASAALSSSFATTTLAANTATSASYALSASAALSASFATTTLASNTATSASYTVSSSYAQFASAALSSSFATTTLTANSASYAVSSSYAQSASAALSSSFATTTLTANSASYALSASYAQSSSATLSASFATTTLTANSATSASYAFSSSYAQSSSAALSSSFATTTLSANSASYAVSSSYAQSASAALSSSFATTTLTANTATSASYALSSSYGVSSSYAQSASAALSSSFATKALDANTATSASYALTSSFALSSSYDVSSSYAQSASAALSSSFATTTLSANSASYAQSASAALSSSFATAALSANTATSSSYATSASYAQSASAALSSSFATTTLSANSSSYATSASYAQSASAALSSSFATVTLTANSASYATSASYAQSASSALAATSAASATSASYAISASYAQSASAALAATSAASATSSSYALTASFSLSGSYHVSGSYAQSASSALVASSAASATSASYALSASSALIASSAASATSSSYATSASYAQSGSSALVASSAASATSASYALSASSALAATSAASATSASYALSASSALIASSAASATSASYALSASSALIASSAASATSASYALSASYARSGSYAQSASAALVASSAASATSSSYAVSSSYAQSSSAAALSTWGGSSNIVTVGTLTGGGIGAGFTAIDHTHLTGITAADVAAGTFPGTSYSFANTNTAISAYGFALSRSGGAINYPDIFGAAGGLVLADVAAHNTQLALTSTGASFNGAAVAMGALIASGGILQIGTDLSRFEGTWGSVPAGATGVGLEVGVNDGVARVQSYNRTTIDYAKLAIAATSVDMTDIPVTTGALTASGAVKAQLLGNRSEYGAALVARGQGTDIEFGHNSVGYGSSLGGVYSGYSFLAFQASAGTNNDTYKTWGQLGSVLRSDLAGGWVFGTLANANADNQALTNTVTISAAAAVAMGPLTATTGMLTDLVSISKSVEAQWIGLRVKNASVSGYGPEIAFAVGQAGGFDNVTLESGVGGSNLGYLYVNLSDTSKVLRLAATFASTGLTLAGTTTTLQGAHPAYIAGSGTHVARFGQVLNSRIDVGNNIWYDGSNWNLDDTGAAGWYWTGVSADPLTINYAAAHSNPVSPVVLMDLTSAGALTLAGALTATTGLFQLNQNAATNLQVTNTDTTNSTSRASVTTTVGTISGAMISIIGNGVYLGTISNDILSIMTNGSQRIAVAAAGDVSIPSNNLLLGGELDSTNAGQFDINSKSGTAAPLRLQRSGGTGGLVVYKGNTTTVNASLTDAAVLTVNGSLVIPSPTDGATVATLKSGGSSTADLLVFGRNDLAIAGVLRMDGSNSAIAIGTTSNHFLRFLTNNTLVATFSTSGVFTLSAAAQHSAYSWILSRSGGNIGFPDVQGAGGLVLADDAAKNTQIVLNSTSTTVSTAFNATGNSFKAVLSTATQNRIDSEATNYQHPTSWGLQNTTEAVCYMVCPRAGHIKSLYAILLNAAKSAGGTIVVTLRLNGADSALTCSFATGVSVQGTVISDGSNSVAVAAGDLIDWSILNNSSGTTPTIGISAVFDS